MIVNAAWPCVLKSSDRSLMEDPLSYFSFQTGVNKGRGRTSSLTLPNYFWDNKMHKTKKKKQQNNNNNNGRGMFYPVCGMMHKKEPLLLIGKSSLCGGSGFPLSLSDHLPYV